jgi:hypothetical protein
VDQVSLRDRADLLALPDLDQKLWVALAMPTRDVDVDAKTLDMLDADKDGRIRVPDLRVAIAWIDQTWMDVNHVLEGGDTLGLEMIRAGKVRAAAERILRDLGKKGSTEIALADATGVAEAFASTTLNGDGIVIPESADAGPTRQLIEDVLATMGSVTDRSGKPGIDTAKVDAFFAEIDKLAAWDKAGDAHHAQEAAAAALTAVDAKIEDYFTRCRLAAFDPSAAVALGPKDADFAAIAGKTLSAKAAELEPLPLAKIEAGAALPLVGPVNPAWAARLAAFAGTRTKLTEAEFRAVQAELAPVVAHLAAKPATAVEKLGMERVRALAAAGEAGKPAVLERIAADKALEGEYAEIAAVEKALRFQRDFARVLRNFVNFSDFYSESDGVFQAGTLYIDGRACHLCVPVTDAGKHGALAGMSAAYLAYCDITKGTEKKTIVAAITNGDADHLMVGRNGVFYDRNGKDWDATISKIVANPISVREAFWTPYKKLVRLIEDQVGKRAAAAEAASDARVQAAATTVASADQAAAAAPPPPAAAPAAATAKKVDVGTVAAIGVAIGGIGALVVGVLSTFLGLGMWMPIGLAALLLLISGPSMLLAWMKLRQRNLGPILDANGWAINGRARINVAFGAALTELAKLPPGAKRTLDDPYADKRSRWKLWTGVAVLLLTGSTWYAGKLDKYLPRVVKSTSVLKEDAPASANVSLTSAIKLQPAPPAAPPAG